MIAAVVASLLLLAVYRAESRRYGVEQVAVAVVTSVRGLVKAARIAAGGAR